MAHQPRSTYRVQLHAGFTFRDLEARLPYLRDLGVHWVYASPVLAAVPGSTHGYDVTDCTRLNPELGSDEDWVRLHERRRGLGLGWLQDIVPNHMAYDLANPWVRELLRHGEASTVARHFDIDWRHPDFRGKVMLPVLGAPLEECVAEGHVRYDAEAGCIRVYDRVLPLSARSRARLPTDGSAPDLEALLRAQHYRLAYWKQTHERINYRRFFTVNGLICLRQERAATFAATHALIDRWVERGEVDGLRLDHIDGLLDPGGYLKRLREAVGEDCYIVVEKILEQGERLPAQWPVQGTTGYDFLALANQLLRDPAATDALAATAAGFHGSGALTPIADQVFDNKRLILLERMAGELDNLVHHARGALAGLPLGMDPALLRAVVADWLCAFPVYRAYPRMGRFRESDRRLLVHAADLAIERDTPRRRGLEMLRGWLRSITRLDDKTVTFLQRAMQLSGPLMAKGIEDTTFYRDFRYLACNEVGDSPAAHAELSVSSFHDRMLERRLTDLNASSTHDTKRAEDARARLHALSADVPAWRRFLQACAPRLDALAAGVPRDVQYLLLQTLVGAYPVTEERLLPFVEKALREGKRYGSWSEPDPDAEAAAKHLAGSLLRDEGFRQNLQRYLDEIEPLAWLNTLRSLVLKCTVPGAPDVYQGTEYLDRSLVDPDNRRPVDYDARAKTLVRHAPADGKLAPAADYLRGGAGDVDKQAVLHRLLAARERWPDLWANASYVPVPVRGASAAGEAAEVLAFRRVFGDDSALVVVGLRTGSAPWPVGDYYGDRYAELPPLGTFEEVLTGRRIGFAGGRTRVADLLGQAPVGVYLPSR